MIQSSSATRNENKNASKETKIGAGQRSPWQLPSTRDAPPESVPENFRTQQVRTAQGLSRKGNAAGGSAQLQQITSSQLLQIPAREQAQGESDCERGKPGSWSNPPQWQQSFFTFWC